MSESWLDSRRLLAIALLGPALEGAILGLRGGPRAMAALGLGLPLIVAGITVLTTPALYVGGALFGGQLSAGDVAASTGRGLRALGLACLGVAPLSLLLAATLPQAMVAFVEGSLLLALAVAVGVHRLINELVRAGETGPLHVVLFGAYTVICGAIGVRLFVELMSFSRVVSS